MMSTGELQTESQPQAQAAAPPPGDASFLDQVIKATPATTKERGAELIRALIDESLKGTVTFDKNMSRTLAKGIAAIDAAMSKQLSAILHHPEFQQLEGTWRGL